MKKSNIVLLIIVSLLLFSFTVAFADETETESQGTFVFPASLQVVEEDAFSGTAAETVILPEGLLEIDDNAFEGTQLKDVFIPNTTENIADTAFDNIPDLTIHGLDGSYAEDWAEEHHIPFVEDNIWNPAVQNNSAPDMQLTLLIRIFALLLIFTVSRRYLDIVVDRRPYDRPEMNAIDYCFP